MQWKLRKGAPTSGAFLTNRLLTMKMESWVDPSSGNGIRCVASTLNSMSKSSPATCSRHTRQDSKASAHNLGLFWEGVWGANNSSPVPDRIKAMQSYRRGGDDLRCQRRLEALR
ncbi:hypothetical protein [Paraburkholderia sp. JHI869]|uniref:hypothetical protein n=1 Tax=Paraburkholderia sp. JHI869 TaxID=3112959 RepID=UPI003176691C